jgi:branched-chain amino acid transport system ATP-binding protein
MLEVKDLSAHYGSIQALRGVSLRVNPGEIVTLIGSNGAGKTTLLNTISGLVRSVQGTVDYGGTHLLGMEPEAIVRLGVIHCPEGRKVFARTSVYDNLLAGAYTRGKGDGVRADAEKMMSRFPRLRDRRRQAAGTLSGGEQQMLAICRSLMARPKILLLDEPSMGLAPALVREIFQIIKEIRTDGTTILLVEQNALMALRTADRAYVLETGEIVKEGPASELLNDDSIRRAYLGEEEESATGAGTA